jgi:hypothetical protein
MGLVSLVNFHFAQVVSDITVHVLSFYHEYHIHDEGDCGPSPPPNDLDNLGDAGLPRPTLALLGFAEREFGIGIGIGIALDPPGEYARRPFEFTRTRLLERLEMLLERDEPERDERVEEVDILRRVWARRGSTSGTLATRAKRARTELELGSAEWYKLCMLLTVDYGDDSA